MTGSFCKLYKSQTLLSHLLSTQSGSSDICHFFTHLQAPAPIRHIMSYNYSYKSSSSGGGAPRATGVSDPMMDAEFQRAKMGAMMGSSGLNTGLGTVGGSGGIDMDLERMRMQREMGAPGGSTGNSSYSYKSSSSSSAAPHVAVCPPSVDMSLHSTPSGVSGGTTTKKVITTTTTKGNAQAARELDSLTKDFNRIGRTPDNYSDDFDSIKKQVLTGQAYDGDVSVRSEPVVTRMREEISRAKNDFGSPITPPSSRLGGLNTGGSTTSTTTTTTRRVGGSGPLDEERITTKTSSGAPLHSSLNTEMYIPIKRQDDLFDDLWLNRWKESSSHFGESQADRQRREWQNQLSDMRRGFHTFDTVSDSPSVHRSIDSSRTVSKNPLGKPEFSVQFEMRDFKPEDISLQTKFGKLHVTATHEDKRGGMTSRREFNRTVDLPDDCQISMMRSVLSRDGILSITAPMKSPAYDTSIPITIHTSQVSPRYQSSLNSPNFSPKTSTTTVNNNYQSTKPVSPKTPTEEPKCAQFSYTLPVAGYSADDIEIVLENRKLRVFGKHAETAFGGRKTYNEFRKMYDLPSGSDLDNVRCYIKNGLTLHVASELNNVEGDIQFLPINYK